MNTQNPCSYGQSDCESTRGGVCVCGVVKEAEVEFPCGHSVSHEEECPRCEIERLRAQLHEWIKANGPGGWIDDLRKRTPEPGPRTVATDGQK